MPIDVHFQYLWNCSVITSSGWSGRKAYYEVRIFYCIMTCSNSLPARNSTGSTQLPDGTLRQLTYRYFIDMTGRCHVRATARASPSIAFLRALNASGIQRMSSLSWSRRAEIFMPKWPKIVTWLTRFTPMPNEYATATRHSSPSSQ